MSVAHFLAALLSGMLVAGTPLLFADDLAAVRGDGVFETLFDVKAAGVEKLLPVVVIGFVEPPAAPDDPPPPPPPTLPMSWFPVTSA